MIIDITGIELIPGNGRHLDENGKPIERCCDDCAYMLCCLDATI